MKYASKVGMVVAFTAMLAAPADAVVRRVDITSPGNGPGSTWSNAYNNLTDALADAQAGDVLWVADGVYKPVNQASAFELEDGIRILGGFIGPTSGNPNGETDPTQRNTNPASNGCVLSGDLNGDDVPATWSNYSDNCYNVVRGSALNHAIFQTEIDAFTIQGGNSSGIPGGGGIQILSSSGDVRILNCRIIDNQAGSEGGGVKLGGVDSAEIRYCDIAHNICGGQGGAGVDMKGSNLNLITSRVTGNSASGPGGGLFSDGGVTNIFNCLMTSNASSGSVGGAIYAQGTSSTTLRIANTLVADNSAPTTAGGGLYTYAQSVEIRNCTFADNVAGTYGGGMYILSSSSATVANSIFWGNTASAGNSQIADNSNPLTVSYSDVQGGWTGATNISSDPQFVGGDVYALTCNSPCIDAGLDADIAADVVDVDEDPLTTVSPWDVEGYARVVDVLGGTDDVDMGAYEGQGSGGCEGDANHDGMVDVDDLIAVINSWGACTAPSSGCLGDVFQHPCGNGAVNVDDLLSVILNWGDCPGFNLGTPREIPQSLQDCMDACNERFPNDPDKWAACVESCYYATGGE